MKISRILITAAIAAACCTDAAAQSAAVYTYTVTDSDGYEFPLYGPLRRVSPNGLWAAGGDEYDDSESFIVNTANPSQVTIVPGGLLLDIDNNGMGVGAAYDQEGYAIFKSAAVFRNGQWETLPLPESIIGQSYAVAVSADSKVIGGHAMCASSDAEETGIVGGKYFPVFWVLNEATGKYEFDRVYNELDLPGSLGFFSYDMTPDGRILCGLQCLNMSDTVAAMFNRETGELKIWNEITFGPVALEYMGETYWFDDAMFVDGVLDGGESGEFHGMFTYATDGYLFGSRDVVTDADDEGNGVITTYATLYDIENDTFFDGRKNCAYLCGVDSERNFTNRGDIDLVTPEDGPFNLGVNEYLDFFCELENTDVAGVYSIDDSSKVWGASVIVLSPLGEYVETPALVMLDNPVFTGIDDVVADKVADIKITREGNTIKVLGAGKVAVYTPSGALVCSSSTATLKPGVYIVVADGVSRKIALH